MALNSPISGYPTAEAAGILDADIYFYGNINLYERFARVSPSDPQSIETLRSLTITSKVTIGGALRNVAILIPTLDTDGNRLDNNQATKLFNQTNQHLGIFAGIKKAGQYAKKLSIASGNIQRSLKQKQKDLLSNPLTTLDFVTYPFDVMALSSLPLSVKESLIIQPLKLYQLISFMDLPSNSIEFETVARNLISISVSYKLSAATEVKLEILDPNYFMLQNNYFIPRRIIKYRGRDYEVAVVDSDVEEGSPKLNVLLRPRAVQLMKRDKQPRNFSGSNGYQFARKLAIEYGLSFVGEESPKKVQTIATVRTKEIDHSAWNTLQETASQGESLAFEMDGCLVYGSEKWLMNKFGVTGTSTPCVPLVYMPPNWLDQIPTEIKNDSDIEEILKSFSLAQWHSYRSSENDVMEADGSCMVLKPNGCMIRPGMTALTGVWPQFFAGLYLIDSVSFSEGDNRPVDVSFRSITKPSSQNKTLISGISPGRKSFINSKALQSGLIQLFGSVAN